MRASYNGNTLASQARAVGSIPIARSSFCISSNFIIHIFGYAGFSVQIPPSPPFAKWGINKAIINAGSSLCKGRVGGILLVMNFSPDYF